MFCSDLFVCSNCRRTLLFFGSSVSVSSETVNNFSLFLYVSLYSDEQMFKGNTIFGAVIRPSSEHEGGGMRILYAGCVFTLG